MEFLAQVCEGHHPLFAGALFGVSPQQKPRPRGPPPHKKTLKAKPRYKLRGKPTRRTRDAVADAQTVQPPEKIEPIAMPSDPPDVPESRVVEVLIDPVPPAEPTSLAQLMKKFFRIVAKQDASNLSRFMRTNANQVNINECLSDTEFEEPCGPFRGWSALHVAAFRGDVDLAQALLDAGADVNLPASIQTEVCNLNFEIFKRTNIYL